MPTINATSIDDSRWAQGNAVVDETSNVRIHYIESPAPEAKDSRGTILLIHGFPQTSYQFRHVINPLSDAGYRVIAPDYRGAGDSSKPKLGYDKVTMATDLHTLIREHLGEKRAIHIVGHDIGGMVAHAYATQFQSDVASVMWGECPLPGGKPYESGFKDSPGMWHFKFHQQLDLPELLTQGRERIYIKSFYDRLCFNPTGITPRDVDHYGSSFAQPGGMRAGFECYRAFDQDSKDNQEWLEKNGKSKVPACALSGDHSLLCEIADEQTKQFYNTTENWKIESSGHWCAEENPQDFVRKVLDWTKKWD